MYSGRVEICGVNTSKLPVICAEDKERLLVAAHGGDKNARDELVMGNLKLVLSVIRRFASRGENPDDLFQIGCIGLIKAIDNFDVTQNVRFSTYAVPMIIGEIRRFLRDNSTIRVSRSVKDNAYRILKAKEELSAALGREPTSEELTEKTGISPKDTDFALTAVSEPVSLFEPVYSEGEDGVFVMDQIAAPDCGEDVWSEKIALSDAVKKLAPREQRILNMRYFDGKTQMEVAQLADISQAQVSRLEKSALEKIKKML